MELRNQGIHHPEHASKILPDENRYLVLHTKQFIKRVFQQWQRQLLFHTNRRSHAEEGRRDGNLLNPVTIKFLVGGRQFLFDQLCQQRLFRLGSGKKPRSSDRNDPTFLQLRQ